MPKEMPKELTTEVVRGCVYTWMLIGRLDGRIPPEITLITSHIILLYMYSWVAVFHSEGLIPVP